MRKINRYVSRSITGSVLMVLLVVMALLLIAALVDEIGSLRGNYTLQEMLIYVGLTLPRRLYEIMPFACLIGCLVGLGLLAGTSELVVMRAAGISVGRIIWMVMKPLSVFILIGVVLGEYVTPYTEQVAESRRAIALDRPTPESRRGSMWHREGNDFMHFNAVLPNGVLYGITRYKFDESRNLVESNYTQQAIYQQGYWQEESISITRFLQPGSAASEEDLQQGKLIGTETDTLASRRWETPMTPELLNLQVAEPEALSAGSLYSYVRYLKEQGLVSSDYSLAFWQKLLQPLATLSLVMIAISFIFGPLREVTMGQRIFTGVVFGVVFRLSQDLLGPSSVVFGFAPVIAVALPIAFCFCLGLYLLNKAR